MNPYSLSHLSDPALLRDLSTSFARVSTLTAVALAHLAEFDARKLYLPAGYPSLFAYCVGELHLSEDAAAKRIQAARLAGRFPAIFPLLAEDRLHLSAVVMLAPYLSPENAAGLLAAAEHQTKAQIEQLLAERFPRPGLLAWVAGSPPSSPDLGDEEHARARPKRSDAPRPRSTRRPPWLRGRRPRTASARPNSAGRRRRR